MSKVGVGAALGVHRQLVVVGVEVDGRHASEAIDIETRRETDAGKIGERRVHGSVDAIECEAAGDESGRVERVVHFHADVVDVGMTVQVITNGNPELAEAIESTLQTVMEMRDVMARP